MAKRTAPTSSPTDAPPLVYDRVELDFVAAEMRAAQKRSPKGGSPATLFLGAGLSKSAGIPLANEFVERILRDDHFKTRFPGRKAATDPDGDGTVLTYPECMKKLTPTERRDVIGPFMEEATLNRAHLAIAQLMKHGYVDRILTVNFDPLLVKACALVGEFPAVYDLATAQDFAPQLMHRKAICYLHGQALGAFLVNTEAEGRKQAKRLAPLLHDTFRDRFVLVAGYSGQNDPLLRAFLSAGAFERHLVWTCYEDEPGDHLDDLLKPNAKQPRFTHALPGQSADTFFVALAEALGCWPPTFLSEPLGYIREALALVREDQNLKEPVERVLKFAERSWEEEGVQVLLNVTSSLVNERFDEAEKIGRQSFASYAGKSVEREFRELTAWAIMLRAGESTPKDYEEACKKAAEVAPQLPQAFSNWGVALTQLSEAEPAYREEYLRNAVKRFEQAISIRPDLPESLFNWGFTLGKMADAAHSPAETIRLWHLEIEKYAQAIVINPTMHQALINWGSTLASLAYAEPERATEHRREAIRKFEQAVAIKFDLHEAFFNWGLVLGALAETKDDVLLLDEAKKKLEAANRITPGSAAKGLDLLAAIRARMKSDPKEAAEAETSPEKPKRRRINGKTQG
ncbi:MAG: hypothetical protein IAE99_06840 [Rhodothermales bacterium]|nr:hypothetical protein [Rhodothermales bacterium]